MEGQLNDENIADVKSVEGEGVNGIMQIAQIHTVYQLSCLSGNGDKNDFPSNKFELPSSASGLLSVADQEGTVLVDASKGLVLSVADMGAILGSQGEVNLNITNSQEEQVGDDAAVLLENEVALTDPDLSSQLFSAKQTPNDGHVLETSDQTAVSNIQTTVEDEQPKKRKGGWPKGKRRKAPPNQDLPRSPATAYAIFAIKKRQEIKKMYPDLAFTEIAKVLGNEWSHMSKEEKEVYKQMAQDDKKRYMEDLKEYQNSESYMRAVKRNKSRLNEQPDAVPTDLPDGSGLISSILDEEGLFCSVCSQCFSSAHNLREHMFGKQHLQAVANACKEEEKKTQEKESAICDLETSDSDSLAGNSFTSSSMAADESMDINNFVIQFLQKNSDREREASVLRTSCKNAHETHVKCVNEFEELKSRISELKQDVATQQAFGAALATQIDTLRMVPTLFGVINF